MIFQSFPAWKFCSSAYLPVAGSPFGLDTLHRFPLPCGFATAPHVELVLDTSALDALVGRRSTRNKYALRLLPTSRSEDKPRDDEHHHGADVNAGRQVENGRPSFRDVAATQAPVCEHVH